MRQPSPSSANLRTLRLNVLRDFALNFARYSSNVPPRSVWKRA